MKRYVIQYDDGAYDANGGWPTTLEKADVYDSREEAQRVADDIGDGCVRELPVEPPTVPLYVTTQGQVPEVVTLLEDALRRAREGEIIGVGLALACTGRAESTAYALGEGGVATLVLATERLKVRLLREGEE